MKTSSSILALVACLFAFVGNTAAQDSNGMVAVLDVAMVFDKCQVFQSRMEAIKAEAEKFKAEMEGQQNAIQTQAARLSEMKPDSEEFRNLESQLTQQTASLQTTARQRNNDLLNREAQIYYDTYQQMQSVVSSLAAEYNITLVLRYDSTPIDPKERGEVVKGVNRSVVYQRDLDLTQMVIERMAKTSSAGMGQNIH